MATDPRWIDEHGNEIDEDHRGLVYDIRTLVDRRRALGLFGGIGVTALLAACASPETTPTASATRHGDHAERDSDADGRPPRHPDPSTRCPTRPAGRTRATARTA